MLSVYISAEKIVILSFIRPTQEFQGDSDGTFMTFSKNICDVVKLS